MRGTWQFKKLQYELRNINLGFFDTALFPLFKNHPKAARILTELCWVFRVATSTSSTQKGF
jgi:hypothetical protein